MKRFKIHWSMRWGIRLIYGGVILFFAAYLGLGLFLKSKLAGDLLVRQLSAQAGRPVHVGGVKLDWLRGFHVILKDVEVPSLVGGPPPISCGTMTTTIEILPFLTRREIVFRHISLKDGSLRLRRERNGKWRGVFVVPVAPVPKTPELRKPKKAKRKLVLFFPKVSLRKISLEVILESEEGNRVYKMFLKRMETVGAKNTETIRGQAEGIFQLDRSSRWVGFKTRGTFSLAAPYPFDTEIRISGFPLEGLGRLYAAKPVWHLRGMSRISLFGRGKLDGSFIYHGRIVMDHLSFHSSKFAVTTPDRESVVTFEGSGGGIVRGSPRVSITVTSPFQAVRLQLLKGGRRIYSLGGVFRNLVASGTMAPHAPLEAALRCDYLLGEREKNEKPGHIRIKGSWTPLEQQAFDLDFLLTRIPLDAIVKGQLGESAAFPRLEAEPEPGQIPNSPPLRFLDRFEGKIAGETEKGQMAIRSSECVLSWGKSRLGIRLAPFQVRGCGPVACEVTAKHLFPGVVRTTPFIFYSLPLRVRAWTRGFRGGEIANLKGKCLVKRSNRGAPRGVKVQSAVLKLNALSFTASPWQLPVDGLSGTIAYHPPSLRVMGLKAKLAQELSLQIKRLEIHDLSKRPLALTVEGGVTSDGWARKAVDLSPPIDAFLHIPLPKVGTFTPEFFSGNIQVNFAGTLFPFNAENYGMTLTDVLLKGRLSRDKGPLDYPVVFTASAVASPRDIEVAHASLDTPLGMIIAEGRASRIASSGAWQIDAGGRGDISFEEKNLYSFLSKAKSFRVTGRAPFSIKARGAWPRLSLQGRLDGKNLFCSYRDIFVKDIGIPASVDFQVNQTGPQSCEIEWIRGKLRGFVVKVWGTLTSYHPWRGSLSCETNTHQFQRLMPLFPRFCSGKQCFLAKGNIQCTGTIDLGESSRYEFRATMADVSLPFPGGFEPIQIAKADFLLNDHERIIDIRDILYRESNVSLIRLKGARQEGKWLWDAKIEMGFLDLDDVLSKIHSPQRENPEGENQPGVDLFAFFIKHLRGRFIRGNLSIQRLKILNYPLERLYTSFQQRGRQGDIKGFNFLTREGYGAIDLSWKETKKGKIYLALSPLVSNLDFGKILDGLLHRTSPFRGWLTFDGKLDSRGGTYQELKNDLNGHLRVSFKKGLIAHWSVLTSIFQVLDIYDIITLKGLPGIATKGLEYKIIHGTVQVKHGVAETNNAYLESQPFFMTGTGTLWLDTHQVKLLIGIYPFKMLDAFVSHIPILGRIFTNKDKKVIGYFFKAEGNVVDPKVTTLNAERYGKRIWDTFKKIITLPIYPFLDHPEKEEKK